MLKAKLSEHLNQEKNYEQWLSKSREDVRKSDDILEKYAIKNRMLSDKLDEASRMIHKMSSSSNKVESLIKSGKHPCDKKVWVMKLIIARFNQRPNRRFQPRIAPEETEEKWRFHSAVLGLSIKPPNKPERKNQSGMKRWFHSAARPPIQTVVSPILVKPREKPRTSPTAIFALKASTQGASADVSEQQQETNYKTHNTQQHISKKCKCEK
ncbi:hypothetical protein LWI29_004066 [Acer saccharum]|uniref:Uncharacterized protein n=1 Tax=Acer saccharum TaxID=4024 RepID=A0AA39VVD7_ACESA|nr:hypothetical protein LWI29_004066 [Acer saccharum]